MRVAQSDDLSRGHRCLHGCKESREKGVEGKRCISPIVPQHLPFGFHHGRGLDRKTRGSFPQLKSSGPMALIADLSSWFRHSQEAETDRRL